MGCSLYVGRARLEPTKSWVLCNDPTISFPLRSETISTGQIVAFIFLIPPLVVSCSIALIRFRQRSVGKLVRERGVIVLLLPDLDHRVSEMATGRSGLVSRGSVYDLWATHTETSSVPLVEHRKLLLRGGADDAYC